MFPIDFFTDFDWDEVEVDVEGEEEGGVCNEVSILPFKTLSRQTYRLLYRALRW